MDEININSKEVKNGTWTNVSVAVVTYQKWDNKPTSKV